MNFDESEQTVLLRDTLRRFLDREMPRELARRLDAQAGFSREVFASLCKLGVTGLTVPEEYGGSGIDVLSAIVVIEELARRAKITSAYLARARDWLRDAVGADAEAGAQRGLHQACRRPC